MHVVVFTAEAYYASPSGVKFKLITNLYPFVKTINLEGFDIGVVHEGRYGNCRILKKRIRLKTDPGTLPIIKSVVKVKIVLMHHI